MTKSFQQRVWWVSVRFRGGSEGWANVVAWTEDEAEQKARDHYGNDHILCVPRIEEVCALKWVPEEAPKHEADQKSVPPGPVGSDDIIP